jgi:hypothetical protein
MYEQIPLSDFKQQHPLREPTGIYVDGELPEPQLRSLSAMNTICFLCNSTLRVIFVTTFVSYCSFRSYVKSCWDFYLRATPPIRFKRKHPKSNITFPMTKAKLDAAEYMCDKQLKGKMLRGEIIKPGKVCNPTVKQVLDICDNLNLDLEGRAWLHEFSAVGTFPDEVFPKCWRGSSRIESVCHWHDWMGRSKVDSFATMFFVGLILLSCGNKFCGIFLLQRCKQWAQFRYLRRQNSSRWKPNRDNRESRTAA